MPPRDRFAPVEMTLEQFLADYAQPPLREAGFRKVRTSTWTVTSAERAVVLVAIRGRNHPAGPQFIIEWAPIPPALRDFHSGGDDTLVPKYEWGMFYARHAPPENPYVDLGGSWTPATSIDEYRQMPATPQRLHAFGEAVESSLRDAIPRWLRALDRDYLASGANADPEFRGLGGSMNGPYLSPLFLYIDSGEPTELRRLMQRQTEPLPRDHPNLQRFTAQQIAEFEERKKKFDSKVLGFLRARLDARPNISTTSCGKAERRWDARQGRWIQGQPTIVHDESSRQATSSAPKLDEAEIAFDDDVP